MKSSNIVWCLWCVATLAGSGLLAGEKNGRKPESERAVSIYTPAMKMWLSIDRDGAGIVGYGAGGSYTGPFKAGTFDANRAIRELKALPTVEKSKSTWKGRFGFKFGSGAMRYTQDSEPVLKMFEKAIEASPGLTEAHERPFLRGQIEKYRLTGNWVVASAETDGKPVAALKGARLKIDDGAIETALEGKQLTGLFKIDVTKAPRQIEFRIGDTSGQWYRTYGVYERDGDTLRICRAGDTASVTGIVRKAASAPEKRPTKLDSKAGVLLVLKREKK